MNGARSLSRHWSMPGSTSASPTPAPRRCTSWPRSTTCRPCAASSASSRASRPVRQTATGAWRDGLLPRLLHLGPGLGNGLANLHNARRARTPIVNVVGDHATYHARYDAPLQSDIASIAGAVSGWYRSSAAGRRRGRRRGRRGGGRLRASGLRRHPRAARRLVVVGVLDRPVPAPAAAARWRWSRPTRSKRSPRHCDRASAPLSCSAGARCAPPACTPPAGSPPPRAPRCSARPSPPISSGARASPPWNAWPTWPRWRRRSSKACAT